MTDKTISKFEDIANKSYIIYSSVLIVVLAILYFYRLHFFTFVFSYGLGCVACYYGLTSSYLHKYVDQLKGHLSLKLDDCKTEVAVNKGCHTCGSKDCARHYEGALTNPWTGLQIHKQLDQAIEDFYNTILDQFVSSWYSKITIQPFFIDELKHQLRYASSCLLQRAIKINYSHLITDRLVPCGLHHYSTFAGVDFRDKIIPHPALTSRNAEINYLRCVTEKIMPYLLNKGEVENSVFHVLVRELFAGWVLLSITDVLADPYILNTLIVLATGDETMANLPTTPNYKVEFLETFVRQTDSVYTQRMKLYKLDLDLVINDQEYFYAFMQYMKANNQIQLLQFYKDIKSFQTKILNPELTRAELQYLCNEGSELNERYDLTGAGGLLNEALGKELGELLQHCDDVKKLQTSPALYQAARQSHAVLEKIMLPRFLHSEEYYKLLIGSRLSTGYHKQMLKKPQDRLLQSALKLGSKVKGALKPTTIDGQILDTLSNSELSEDGIDNMDILKYLESITAEERDQDLSAYKVVLTNVETRLQAGPRRGTVRVFSLAIHLCSAAAARLWTLDRSEHDFHLLRTKLREFHSLPHAQLQLPSRRDNSPLETIRYKYEDFLQRLLQEPLLQTSELLHLFLTVDGDFSTLVQASTLNANSTDLANFYQSVAHKLRKEKGQHLEGFLRNFLVSSDMDRYQALKQGNRDIEEAYEVNEDIELEPVVRTRNTRNLLNSVFENNWDMQDRVVITGQNTLPIQGAVSCVMYILIKVINARFFITAICGSILSIVKEVVDQFFYQHLNKLLKDLLTERRLAHLIRLGQGLLFGKKSSTRVEPTTQCEVARRQLLGSIPGAAAAVLGPGLPCAVSTAFDLIQNPQLNKQLVYNLLDICLIELFPELNESTNVGIKT